MRETRYAHLLIRDLQGYAPQAGVRYFGSFLVCAAANGGVPTVMAYQVDILCS